MPIQKKKTAKREESEPITYKKIRSMHAPCYASYDKISKAKVLIYDMTTGLDYIDGKCVRKDMHDVANFEWHVVWKNKKPEGDFFWPQTQDEVPGLESPKGVEIEDAIRWAFWIAREGRVGEFRLRKNPHSNRKLA